MTDELPGAGPEMDAMVSAALGQNPDDPQSWPWGGGYSTSRCNAMWALMGWRAQHPGWGVTLDLPAYATNQTVVRIFEYAGDAIVRVQAPTLAVAICHAIVRASREVQSYELVDDDAGGAE